MIRHIENIGWHKKKEMEKKTKIEIWLCFDNQRISSFSTPQHQKKKL